MLNIFQLPYQKLGLYGQAKCTFPGKPIYGKQEAKIIKLLCAIRILSRDIKSTVSTLILNEGNILNNCKN